MAFNTASNGKFSLRDIALCALFCALIIVSTFVRIPLPMLSLTLQNLVVVMAGLLLGPGKGALAVSLYVVLGLLGLPVFTTGGGIGYVVQPSFGYLLGFIAAAPVSAWVLGKGKGFFRCLLAVLAGFGTVYLIGLPYMYLVYAFYLRQPLAVGALFLHGFFTPLPGDLLKSVLGAYLAYRLVPLVRRR